MTDELEKACKKWCDTWLGGSTVYPLDSAAANLTAFVRKVYQEGRLEGVDARPLLERIAALEAQQEADHAWIDADAKTKGAQQDEIQAATERIAALEAANTKFQAIIAGDERMPVVRLTLEQAADIDQVASPEEHEVVALHMRVAALEAALEIVTRAKKRGRTQ